jgi:hypothetical protein
VNPEQFKVIYPQFSEVSDDVIERNMNDFRVLATTWMTGELVVDEGLFERCEGLYTAHTLTVDLSFPIGKDNIEQGLARGKFVAQEQTPDFTVSYGSYNSADDFKTAVLRNEKEKELSLIYLQKAIEKYYKYFDIFVEIPIVTGAYCEHFKETMYGQRLLYAMSLIENFIWQYLKKKLETEVSARIKEISSAPLALLV